MTTTEKQAVYKDALREINAVLMGETLMITKMASINCILKEYIPYYFWVGFYCVHKGTLVIGPYQGTLGCLHIPFSKGICGRAARTETTQLIKDVHADSEHLACDNRSNSEIVIPVFDADKKLIAVFDVDSTEYAAFDEIDREYLEIIMMLHFNDNELEKSYEC